MSATTWIERALDCLRLAFCNHHVPSHSSAPFLIARNSLFHHGLKCVGAILLFLATLPGFAAVSFKSQIAPVLLERCVACHGPEKARGGYRLDSFEGLTKPGESKLPPISAGEPDQSHLFQLITTKDVDDRMPQKGDPLSAEQIALIRDWIVEGTKFDGASPQQNLAEMAPYRPGPEPLTHYPFPQPVLALAWSEDGKLLASSGYHEALIWSDEGKLAQRVSRLPERIHGLAFLKDGRLAVAAGNPGRSGEVLLCKTDASETPQLLARLPDVATCLALSKDRTLLAAGGSDNAIRLYNATNGSELAVIKQHADWVTALAFSPDGSRLVSASRDRTARLFDTKTGELLETYAEHVQPVFAIAFSDDGKRAFSAGREKRIHAWTVVEAKKNGEFAPLEGDVLALAVAGKRIFASGGDKRIYEFGMDDRKQIRLLEGHGDWIYALAYQEGSQRLASGAYDGEIRIWNAVNGSTLTSFRANP